MKIVSATAEHIEAMSYIEEASYHPDLITTANGYEKILAAPAELGEVFVILNDVDEVRGIGHFRMSGGVCTIFNLVVDPLVLRQGYGKTMLREILERSRQAEMKRVQLYVEQSNAPALALYDRHGFRKDSVLLEYYPNNADGWLMDLILDKAPILGAPYTF